MIKVTPTANFHVPREHKWKKDRITRVTKRDSVILNQAKSNYTIDMQHETYSHDNWLYKQHAILIMATQGQK